MQVNSISLFITRIVLAGWISMKLISAALWNSTRPFPLFPIAEIFEYIPSWFHLFLYWSSLFCMIAFLFFNTKKLLWVVLIAELASCMFDQTRWQPWEYQNILMLGCYLFFSAEKQLLSSWQIAMIGIYFFSGLSKFQPAFIYDIWLKIVLNKWLHINTNNINIIRAGYILALTETCAAIALCFNYWRKIAIGLLIIMHCFILLVLGPWGINFNKVIWPWNIVMTGLLFLLFYRSKFLIEPSFLKRPFGWIVITCFCVLPFLGLVNKWDHYLSFHLYSGGINQLYICTNDSEVKQKLGHYFLNTSNTAIPCPQSISSFTWAMKVMHVPDYPEQRIFVSMAKYFKSTFPNAAIKFYVYTPGLEQHVEELDIHK